MKRRSKTNKEDETNTTSTPQDNNKGTSQEIQLHPSLEENLKSISKAIGNSDDVVIRKIKLGKGGCIEAGIIYTDGIVDTKSIYDFILEPLMIDFDSEDNSDTERDLLDCLRDSVVAVGNIQECKDFQTLYSTLFSGHVIVLINGFTRGFTIDLSGGKDREVAEATQESVVRGPREAFTESLRTNTALIRRKINDSNLWVESKKIGRVTKTQVSVMYIKGIVNDKVLEEVRERLDRIEIDGILESGYIEELIEDKTFSPFPTIYNTERPDVVAACLLEGRVAILVNGTPFVLVVPSLFTQFFQAAEDYYQRWDFSTLIRFLRLICFFIALLAPSIFIAVTTYHHEMIPTPLLISLASQREGVPFPAFVEALIMEVTFEILREGGIRMPRAIGQAVSIVGTLVIGTAAVEAGIVSAAMVIVVSITAIASFVVPSNNMGISIRMIRFLFMGLAASFGIFGITAAFIAMILHLCSLRSFGIPYMSPFGPFNVEDQKDSLFRFPHWGLISRPHLMNHQNVNRENSPSPTPPDNQ
ncbi:spore germination protein [Rossellomorea sp. DUT-2]|uniref:spore germination protein n=1 Tax=Rossellomorea sp. DUT-2 TaxID=3412021 RepID=UPI003D179BAF